MAKHVSCGPTSKPSGHHDSVVASAVCAGAALLPPHADPRATKATDAAATLALADNQPPLASPASCRNRALLFPITVRKLYTTESSSLEAFDASHTSRFQSSSRPPPDSALVPMTFTPASFESSLRRGFWAASGSLSSF